MEIRSAKKEDIPALLKLLRQVLTVHHVGRPDLFKPNAEKYTAPELEEILSDPKRPIFVAVEEDRVLGYAFCIYRQILGSHIRTDIQTLYIDDLCVDEACRGQQVGTGLYEYVLSVARQNHCYNVELNVWACNESAVAFYEKRGMKPQKIGMETIL